MDDELTLKDLVEILRRKKNYILLPILLFVGLAGVYLALTPPVYQSTAALSVAPLKVRARLENKIELQPTLDLDKESVRALAQSQPILLRVAESALEAGFVEASDPTLAAAQLRKRLHLKITESKQAGQGARPLGLFLSAKAKNPETAAFLANRWAESLAAALNGLPAVQLRKNLDALKEQLADAEKAFREAQSAWEAFQRENALASLRAELQRLENRNAEIRLLLHKLPTELAQIKAQLSATTAQLNKTPSHLQVRRSVVEDPLVATATAGALNALRGLRLQSEEPNPTWLRLRQRADDLTIQRATLLEKRRSLQAEMEKIHARIAMLRAEIAKTELTQKRLKEQLDLAQKVYLALKQKQTDLKIELASLQSSLAQILAPAYPDPEPVAPRKMLTLALAGFMGLFVGIAWAFVSAALENGEPGPETRRAPATE